MRTIAMIQAGFLTCLAVLPARVSAVELKPEAGLGFDRYVHLAEARMRTDLRPGGAFLWVDRLPQDRRGDAYRQLHNQEVVTNQLDTPDSSSEITTPGAMIHHWIGAVFIPHVSLPQVIAVLQDYDHHAEYYSPSVQKSKTLAHSGDDFKVFLRLQREKVITVVFDTDYEVHYERLDAARAQSRSYSTRIAQVDHPGEAGEHELPIGNDDGFLWRLNSYWRFLEKDQGVYVQCEAISLTRDIPAGLNWLVGPFLETIPRESLEFTLQSTRAAVVRQTALSSR